MLKYDIKIQNLYLKKCNICTHNHIYIYMYLSIKHINMCLSKNKNLSINRNFGQLNLENMINM